MNAREALLTALADFAPASPDLVERRQLLRRIDAKYVINAARVVELVRGLAGYAVLPVAGGALATYRNLYFDSADLQCFHDHRRGRRIRHKIRIRHYPDRELSYLEIKSKRNEMVTDKQRMKLAYGGEHLAEPERAFLREHVGSRVQDLEPTVRIDYRRIALIALANDERLTIDLDLEVADRAGNRTSLGDLAIIEVKRPPAGHAQTAARLALAHLGARERSISKYCAAIALLRPEVPANRLRPSLRIVEAFR